jgi:hypothetical protein
MGDQEYQYPMEYMNDPKYLDYGGNMGYPF